MCPHWDVARVPTRFPPLPHPSLPYEPVSLIQQWPGEPALHAPGPDVRDRLCRGLGQRPGTETQQGWEAESLCLLVAKRGRPPSVLGLRWSQCSALWASSEEASPPPLCLTPAQVGVGAGPPQGPAPRVAQGSVRPFFYWFILWF